MFVRISIYDFFAYTIPGVCYLLLLFFILSEFQIVDFGYSAILDSGLTGLLLIIGFGYIIGIVFDSFAYQTLRIFMGRNGEVRSDVWTSFQSRYPFVDLPLTSREWALLIYTLKSNDLDLYEGIESHNVSSIMLRNITLVCGLASITFLSLFLFKYANVWNLIAGVLLMVFATISMIRSNDRRKWYYTGILEAYTSMYLIREQIESGKINRPTQVEDVIMQDEEVVMSTVVPISSSEQGTAEAESISNDEQVDIAEEVMNEPEVGENAS